MLNIFLGASQPFEFTKFRILCLAVYLIFNRDDCLDSNFLSPLYILGIRLLLDIGLVKIFSQSVGCCFVLLRVSFVLQKL